MNNYDNVKRLKDTIYSKNLDCFIKEMEGDFFIEKKKMVWDSLVWDRYYNFYKYVFLKVNGNCLWIRVLCYFQKHILNTYILMEEEMIITRE